MPWYSIKDSIESAVISEGITRIGEYAFYDLDKMLSVSLPESLIEIGNSSFNRSGIKELSLPSNLTTIGNGAFGWCWGIGSVTIPDSVTSIGAGAFNTCARLTTVQLSKNITVCSKNLFGGSRLTSISIPDGVTLIEENAFRSNDITYIYLPDSITSIKQNAFESCSKLTDIYYSGTIDDARQIAIENVGNTSLTSSVWHYEYDSWKKKQLVLPSDLIRIEDEAFSNTSFGIVYIPNGCKAIGNSAFSHCSDLHRVYIPESVSSIANNAFDESINVIIYGKKGSYIETWSLANNLQFEVY